jgi:hypothetical protein
MNARRIGMALAALTMVACATTLPPPVVVTSLAPLAGTYSGSVKETSEYNRSARLVLKPDGFFELAVSDPHGFRTLGSMSLGPDGILRYKYDELRGRGEILTGTGTVHEGDGKRALVLSHDDGTTVTTLWRDLP